MIPYCLLRGWRERRRVAQAPAPAAAAVPDHSAVSRTANSRLAELAFYHVVTKDFHYMVDNLRVACRSTRNLSCSLVAACLSSIVADSLSVRNETHILSYSAQPPLTIGFDFEDLQKRLTCSIRGCLPLSMRKLTYAFSDDLSFYGQSSVPSECSRLTALSSFQRGCCVSGCHVWQFCGWQFRLRG